MIRRYSVGAAINFILLPLAFAIGLIACASGAQAHTKSISYSSWHFGPEGASVRVRITRLELTRLGLGVEMDADEARIANYLRSRLQLFSAGQACKAQTPIRMRAPEGWMHFEWRLVCDVAGEQRIQSAILLAEAPSHLHFARVHASGFATRERVLSERDPSWNLEPLSGSGASGPVGTSISGYLAIGVEHILSGWDHLAFVFALLLLAGSVGEVARLVTGFTLAHSVTLALAVLGILNPETAPIEALIGFSVALVATENAWLLAGGGWSIPLVAVSGLLLMAGFAFFGIGLVSWLTLLGISIFAACHFGLLATVRNPRLLRVAVAFAFGLIHGFGFAGILREMSLPSDRLVQALFGFNLGVELGQLAIVLLVWPALHALARWNGGRLHTRLAELGSAAICGLGVFWFVTRSFA
ncbi:MAG: HupE/UreJ family protein [Myxococcales bacterium]|nr:HupE/UreJ family protein [Myxococcales bacterium]